MTAQDAERVRFHFDGDLIMWSLCGRSEVKGIYTETKQRRVGNKSRSEQQVKHSEDCNSPHKQSVGEAPDKNTLPDRLAMIQSLAIKTFPPQVQLCWSSIPGYRLGVMATDLIPQGALIGPYEGKLVKPDKLKNCLMDRTYLWEILHDNQILYYVDGSEIPTSNWMRYIQCARTYSEQNVSVIQHWGSIYYRVLRDIHAGEEVLVWYDESYPQYMGIPLMAEPTLTKYGTDLKTMSKNKIVVNTTVLQASSKTEDEEVVPRASLSNISHESQFPHNEENLQKSTSKGKSEFKDKSNRRSQKHEHFCSRSSSVSTVLASEPTSSDGYDNNDNNALKCKQCSKSFLQRYTLQVHLCPKQTNAPYQCGYCNLLFPNPSDLRNHVVKHVSEKPFKCGFCSRSFVGSTTLNNHIRIHTGEKELNCEKCGVRFSQGAQYSSHLRLDCKGVC